MLARWRDHRRGATIVVAAGLAAVALAVVLAAVATARRCWHRPASHHLRTRKPKRQDAQDSEGPQP